MNWTAVLHDLIITSPMTIFALAAFIQARKNGIQAKQTHELVNGQMTEMKTLIATASKAEGKLEGIAEAKNEG